MSNGMYWDLLAQYGKLGLENRQHYQAFQKVFGQLFLTFSIFATNSIII